MSKECDIVKDLLINYVDDNLRECSKVFVEEHLKECKECTDYLKIVEEDVSKIDTKKDEKEINFFKKINEKIKSKSKAVKVLLVCLSLLIVFNIGVFINYNIFMNNTGMEVFLEDDINAEEKTKIIEYIKNSDVKEYSFKSKEDALNQMKEKMGENSNILIGYNDENNIFPESFVITAEKDVIEKISGDLSKMNGVKRITTQTSYNPYEVFIISIIKK